LTKKKTSAIYYVNNKKGQSMIKATIKSKTKRSTFAQAGGKKIAGGTCSDRKTIRGLVLNNYKVIASGTCRNYEQNNNLDNVLLFKKSREVA
jgi:hypothetical protein